MHLELLGTVERVAQAKAELIESLPEGGTAVVPAGEAYLEPYLGGGGHPRLPLRRRGRVSLSYFAAHDGSARIRVEAFGAPLTLEFSFSSRYNATNALAASPPTTLSGSRWGRRRRERATCSSRACAARSWRCRAAACS